MGVPRPRRPHLRAFVPGDLHNCPVAEGTKIGGAGEAAVTGAWIGAIAWLVYLVGAAAEVPALRGGAELAWALSVLLTSLGLFGLRGVGPWPTLCGLVGAAAIALSILIGVWMIGAGFEFGDRGLRVLSFVVGGSLLCVIVGLAADAGPVWVAGTLASVVAYPLWTVRLARALDERVPIGQ
jgi:hypothetical protein